jgi:hypothetical protein
MIEFTDQQHEHFENSINVLHAHYIAPKVSLKPNPGGGWEGDNTVELGIIKYTMNVANSMYHTAFKRYYILLCFVPPSK